MGRTAKRSVRRPYERVKLNVRNQSSRDGVRPKLIVLHTTEGHDRPGVSDLYGLGSWFDNRRSQASSHVGVDGEGFSALFVPDSRKAWTCGHYNRVSLNIEQIGFARFSPKEWAKRRKQIRKVAQYIAHWSKEYGIPIRKGRTHNGQVSRTGVVSHRSLGQLGGGHHDPGLGFPFRATLALARYYRRRGW